MQLKIYADGDNALMREGRIKEQVLSDIKKLEDDVRFYKERVLENGKAEHPKVDELMRKSRDKLDYLGFLEKAVTGYNETVTADMVAKAIDDGTIAFTAMPGTEKGMFFTIGGMAYALRGFEHAKPDEFERTASHPSFSFVAKVTDAIAWSIDEMKYEKPAECAYCLECLGNGREARE